MNIRSRTPIFAAMIFMVAYGAFAGFSLKSIDEDFLEGDGEQILTGYKQYVTNVTFDKLPENVSQNPKYGTVKICGKRFDFIVYDSKNKTGNSLDTVIFDLNDDKDLTNDTVFDGFKTGEFKDIVLDVPDKGSFTFSLSIQPYAMNIIPRTWY